MKANTLTIEARRVRRDGKREGGPKDWGDGTIKKDKSFLMYCNKVTDFQSHHLMMTKTAVDQGQPLSSWHGSGKQGETPLPTLCGFLHLPSCQGLHEKASPPPSPFRNNTNLYHPPPPVEQWRRRSGKVLLWMANEDPKIAK